MKSCIEWRKSFKYLPQIDQFNIDFRNKQIKLLQFLQLYAKSQRVNIRLPGDFTEENIELLNLIYEKGYNIAIVLPSILTLQDLQKIKAPYYFQELATCWDELINFISLKVSDVFVSCELGFELDAVKALLENTGIQIRCYANISQSKGDNTKGIKGFYIRPEDIDIYGKYIDIIEFFGSVTTQNALYEIYFHDKKWDGKLNEIIKGIKSNVNNYYILSKHFAEYRTKCAKKCLKSNDCQLCDKIISLANSLRDSEHYQVFRKRDKKDG